MSSKECYWKNPELNRKRSLDYYYANREDVLKKFRAYARKNRERRKAYNVKYRELNGEIIAAKQKAYYWTQRESRLAKCKIWRDSNPDYNPNRIARRHGLTLEQYKALLVKQAGLCAICGQLAKKLLVDHDHSCCAGKRGCGKCVRGLLCSFCNHALGHFRDNAVVVIRAAEYLRSNAVSIA